MALASVCETCGYHPRNSDTNLVDVQQGWSSDDDGYKPIIIQVLHVICYGCGNEWVE